MSRRDKMIPSWWKRNPTFMAQMQACGCWYRFGMYPSAYCSFHVMEALGLSRDVLGYNDAQTQPDFADTADALHLPDEDEDWF